MRAPFSSDEHSRHSPVWSSKWNGFATPDALHSSIARESFDRWRPHGSDRAPFVSQITEGIKQLRDLFRGRPDFVVNFVAVQLQFLRFIQKFRIGTRAAGGDADRGRWSWQPPEPAMRSVRSVFAEWPAIHPHFREGFASSATSLLARGVIEYT